MKNHQGRLAPRFDPDHASALFLRAAIEMRLGNVNAAREAYQKALPFHSMALRESGHAYTGDYWNVACAAELLRREAASLLGDATPPDAPVPTNP